MDPKKVQIHEIQVTNIEILNNLKKVKLRRIYINLSKNVADC